MSLSLLVLYIEHIFLVSNTWLNTCFFGGWGTDDSLLFCCLFVCWVQQVGHSHCFVLASGKSRHRPYYNVDLGRPTLGSYSVSLITYPSMVSLSIYACLLITPSGYYAIRDRYLQARSSNLGWANGLMKVMQSWDNDFKRLFHLHWCELEIWTEKKYLFEILF